MSNEKKFIEINSLQEYVAIFDKQNFSGNFYYRGEPKDYSSIKYEGLDTPVDTRNMASGYRWMLENNKMFDDLLRLREEYHREVGHSLNEKETENFISFAQHHGLPTELLDITSNPVVALYFACESKESEDGYIYLFDNTFYGIEERHKKKFYYNMYRDLTSSIITNDIKKQKRRLRWMDNVSEDHVQFDLIEEHNNFVYSLFRESDGIELLNEARQTYWRIKEENTKLHYLINDDARKIFDSSDDKEAKKHYREIFSDMEDFERIQAGNKFCINTCLELVGLGKDRYFPNLKLLLFKPSIIFDRMKNQEGCFIYQLNYEMNKTSVNQKVNPSHTIVIPADKKKKILSQLDNIGINQKFIYPDLDNIASYIKNNYSKSIWRERNSALIEHNDY